MKINYSVVIFLIAAAHMLGGCTFKSVPLMPNCNGMSELECMQLLDEELTTFEGYDRMPHMEGCPAPLDLTDLYDRGKLTLCVTPNAIPICADIMSNGSVIKKTLFMGALPVGCTIIDGANGCDPQFADMYYARNDDGRMGLFVHEMGHVKGFPDEWYVSGVEVTYYRDKYIGKMCQEVDIYDN